MAIILNIESSGSICSVALGESGNLIDHIESRDERAHATQLSPMIGEILEKNHLSMDKLSAVAVSKGPGSYTGLRIGISTAKGICYALGIPLIAINSMRILTEGAKKVLKTNALPCPCALNEMRFRPLIDARRMEVYTALYSYSEEVIKETSALIVDHTSFTEELQNNCIAFFGSGLEKCKSSIESDHALFIENIESNAAYMVEMAQEKFTKQLFENTAYFEPFYLKDFVATKPKRKVL